MVRDVLQVLNYLSIHVTFAAIVPGAYSGKPKYGKNGLLELGIELETIEGRRVCCEAFYKHRIPFPYMPHLRKLPQGRIRCANVLIESNRAVTYTSNRYVRFQFQSNIEAFHVHYISLFLPRPIRLFSVFLLNNIASGGLSATAELLVKIP